MISYLAPTMLMKQISIVVDVVEKQGYFLMDSNQERQQSTGYSLIIGIYFLL